MDLLYPCKTCGHAYEDHLVGLSCAFCWADAGFNRSSVIHNMCKRFIGDNLKYLEEKHAES